MSLRAIVRRLGGDLYDDGRRANIPAPGHSRQDRSVSLLERDGRVIVHTFGDGDWRAVRDHLRDLGLLGPHGAGATARSPASAPSCGQATHDGLSSRDDVDREGANGRDADRAHRRRVARCLWAQGRAIDGTLSERHCRGRGLVGPAPGGAVLRHHPSAPLSVYRPSAAARPALMAGVADADGAVCAVELTYLTPGGRRACDLALPRKTVGVVPAGSAVRLDPSSREMLVAEGLFTTLAARRRFALPAWALLSTSNLRRWRPPPGVAAVLIAADRGCDGEASARILAQELHRLGVVARIALPPAPFGDWDEADRAGV